MRGRAHSMLAGWRAAVSPRRLSAAALVCALGAVLVVPVPAGANVFGPISLVSESAPPAVSLHQAQQAEYAHDPAISGSGQYVAFDGSIGGVSGVWRRNLATGEIQQVAGGDAELPSISENGQYISFTTNEGSSLAEITNGLPVVHHKVEAANVYRRDMEVPIPESGHCEPSPQECPFTVVSAPDETAMPLTYEAAGTSLGSAAVGRSAMSANGNEVAFVTTAVSNLVRYPKVEEEEIAKGETPKPHTPALQVAVRYLDIGKTVLVSGRYVEGRTTEEPVFSQEGSTTYGAVFPGGSWKPPGFGPPPPYGQYGKSPPLGASISADGSTAAWMGADIGEQAQMLPSETRSPSYTEPLWRRIAPGSQTSTERITGGSDPTNPACVASGEITLPSSPTPADPCQGPFEVVTGTGGQGSGIWAGGGSEAGDFVPRLSADGYTVAFIAEAPLVSLGENFGRGGLGQESDLYVADMHSDPTRPTREQALTQLTELAGGESAGTANTAPIFDFDISSDGSQVAFTTRRTQFPLGSPAYVTAPAAEPGMDELFDVDLRNHTLTRVTHGYAGGPSEQPHPPVRAGLDPYGESEPGLGALSPSFSADGTMLAFSSTASNLVFGDGNTPGLEQKIGSFDGGDAFVTSRVIFGSTPHPQYVSSAPAPSITPVWDLGVTALSRPDGSVELYVQVPGAGKLRALARGIVLVRSARAVLVRSGRARPATRHSRTSSSRRGHGRASTVATRTVALAGTYPDSEGLLTLTLKLTKPYSALASQRGGLSATVSIAFTAAGRPTLQQSLPVTFERTASAPRRSRRTRAAAHRGSRG